MSTITFRGVNGGAPFPRNAGEWIEKGVPPEQAEHRMRADVFGQDYQTDAKGQPVEKGKGSAAQPTFQHQQALGIAQEAEARRQMTMGWHPGLANAFDPRQAPAPRRRQVRRTKPKAKPPAPAPQDA